MATEVTLSQMASQKAGEVVKGKREAARRKGVPQAAAASRREGRSISCSVLAAIAASRSGGVGTRTRTAITEPSAEPVVQGEVRLEKSAPCLL